ncbi:hypothetical protein TURU_066171 [Turdus rufiventris]|nr:hypothetical protein TURU_066171 [Turdus rufiventris]
MPGSAEFGRQPVIIAQTLDPGARSNGEFALPKSDLKSKSDNTPLCFPNWSEIRQNLEQDKDFNSSKGQFLAMPVKYGKNDHNPQYEALSHHDIKELRQAIKENGLASLYFDNTIESIYNCYALALHIAVMWLP